MLTYNQEQLIYWITERESIRLKKLTGHPAPWTDNPVMRETYFCNVDREDDNVTKWIRENWLLTPNTSMYYDFSMVVARIFNLPSTLELIGQPLNDKYGFDELESWLNYAYHVLLKAKREGKIWNGAYIVSTNGKKLDKLTHCFNLFKGIDRPVHITEDCYSLKEAHKRLMTIDGLASFLAGQVVADLKNTEGHPLQDADDWWDFSAPGPGSLRGLTWFFEEKVTAKNYNIKINEASEILDFELPTTILNKLCFQNLQNCFCEYDKFMRVTNKTGKSKRKYKKGSI